MRAQVPTNRPRPYTTLDREYLAQDTIRDLGDEFGSDGPLVFLALILNAGKAISGQAPAAALGVVEMRWRTLAREAFVEVDIARAVVAAALNLGLLDGFAELDGARFSARLTKAERWEARPLTGAERTAAWRARHEPEGEAM